MLFRSSGDKPIFHFAQFAQLSEMGQVTFRDGEEMPNYPMNGDSIRMILHTRTGTFPRDDYMEDDRKQLKIHAGSSKSNDYLLGNNGYGNKETSHVNIRLSHIMKLKKRLLPFFKINSRILLILLISTDMEMKTVSMAILILLVIEWLQRDNEHGLSAGLLQKSLFTIRLFRYGFYYLLILIILFFLCFE